MTLAPEHQRTGNDERKVRLFSNLNTTVAYGGEPAPDRHPTDLSPVAAAVEIKPGLNILTLDQADALGDDPNFRRHMDGKFIFELEDDAPVPDMNVSVSPPTAVPAAAGGAGDGGGLTVPASGANAIGGSPNATPRPSRLADKERRTKLKDEKPAAYKARMASYDAEDAAYAANEKRVAFLADFDRMTDEEKTAMEPTLTDEEKGWLADRAPVAPVQA